MGLKYWNGIYFQAFNSATFRGAWREMKKLPELIYTTGVHILEQNLTFVS
jgi:hypothetical protein